MWRTPSRKFAIGTLMERHTRYVMPSALPAGKKAEGVREALATTVQRFTEHPWQSLTWDQGKEMAHYAQFPIDTGVRVYFCDPKSPYTDRLDPYPGHGLGQVAHNRQHIRATPERADCSRVVVTLA